MADTQKSTGQPPLAPVPGPGAGSSSAADTSADTQTIPRDTLPSKRRRRSQNTKTKAPPKPRTTKTQLHRELLQKYIVFTNLYQDYMSAKEELFKKYRETGCQF